MTSTAADIAKFNVSPMMLAVQVVMLGWWIVDNRVEPREVVRSMTAKVEVNLTTADVALPQSNLQERLDERVLSADIALSIERPIGIPIDAKKSGKSSARSKRDVPSPALPSPSFGEQQTATEPKGKEDLVKRALWKRDVDDAHSECSSSSASSYSSSGSLSNDEESIYSDSSAAPKEMSISAKVAAQVPKSQVPLPLQAAAFLSGKDNPEKTLSTPDTPASASVEDTQLQQKSTALMMPIKIVATDNDPGPKVADDSIALLPVATHSEPSQRASKIIAQLDSLLFDELENLAMLSPADTEVMNSATSRLLSASPLTPRVAALERKRGVDLVEMEQTRQIGERQISNENPVSPLKVSMEILRTLTSEKLTRSRFVCANKTGKRNTPSIELDDLLATRMSDLFPSSIKSSMHPELAPGARTPALHIK
ncbi:hypothetical protein QFC21_004091 [Naganishia friedmannii]|uniref:Uncharacterized protein n=1 Tax=Naganishia friedmannii TaxID=89922 RepID=A0ACC2VK91_9TREE|nr:hypothetical protein QFC21_004091 [Naganishia friedmannii]